MRGVLLPGLSLAIGCGLLADPRLRDGGHDTAAHDARSRADVGSDASSLDASRVDANLPDTGTDGGSDAGRDASLDAARDAGFDTGLDAARDAGFDTGLDASFDAARDASFDAARDTSFDAARDASFDAARDASFDAARDATTRPWGFCGDGVVQLGEACDSPGDTRCTTACSWAFGASGSCTSVAVGWPFATEAGSGAISLWQVELWNFSGSSRLDTATLSATTTDEGTGSCTYLRTDSGLQVDGWISPAPSGCGTHAMAPSGGHRVRFLRALSRRTGDLELAIGTDNQLFRVPETGINPGYAHSTAPFAVWFIPHGQPMPGPHDRVFRLGTSERVVDSPPGSRFLPTRFITTLPRGGAGTLVIDVEESGGAGATNNTGLYVNLWMRCPSL